MRCRYERKIYQNEQNGYTVAVFSTQDSSVPLSARDKRMAALGRIGFTAIGYGLPLTDRIELEMEGSWENSSYGQQYIVDTFMEIVPRTKEGIIGYLSSGAVKGVGQKTAEAIFREFGLQSLEVMENEPERLLCIRGISERKLIGIRESFQQNRTFRELMTFLAPYHVTPKKVNLILKKFKDKSFEIIRRQPYMLCAVKGFGFLTVDAIGQRLGCALNDPMRISGCVSYIMQEAQKEGHLYLAQEVLTAKTLELLNKDLPYQAVSSSEVGHVLYRLVLQENIVMDGTRIYISRQYEEERQTAAMIAKRLLAAHPTLPVEKELDKAQAALGLVLSERQKEAVRMVFGHPISIITGGPGTGKTTVLRVILHIHERLCRTGVQLMAPTGRAARRMAEATGNRDASTMHMALGLFGDRDSCEAGLTCLDASFLNVDEVSMVDMHLAYEFFRRVRSDARILLVGDIRQLPSVGAGDVFRQLIGCGLIPVTVLDTVYRQGANSNIPVNAQLIQRNETKLCMGDDFEFYPCKGVESAAQIVRELYLKEIAIHGVEGVQILTPYRTRTAAGVKELNRALEDLVNPPLSGKKELSVGGEVYRAGDKVMQNKNTEQVSNGDMGIIQDFFEDEEGSVKVRILFSEEREVEYESDQMEMVEHANAITIHKSQGSECPVVIIPWVKAFYMMLKRNILYTGITRAREKVCLVGEWSAVCQAIHTDDTGSRNTVLGERIREYFCQYQAQAAPPAAPQKLAI